jgi:hypothetical protein
VLHGEQAEQQNVDDERFAGARRRPEVELHRHAQIADECYRINDCRHAAPIRHQPIHER